MKTVKIQSPLGEKINFELNPTQAATMEAFEDNKFVVMGGAVRAGKTWMLGLMATLWSMWHGNIGVICRGTYEELHEIIWKDTIEKFFFKPLFEGLYKVRTVSNHVRSVELAPEIGGSKIQFLALKDPTGRRVNVNKGVLGKGIGWFAIDQSEACWPQAFNFLVNRLSLSCVPKRHGFLNLNPAGRDWNWSYFINPATKRKDSFFIQSRLTDNAKYLPQDYIDSMNAMHGDYVDRYVEGNFTSWDGLVYPMLNEATHCIPPLQDLPKHQKIYVSVDHGMNNPVSIGFYTILSGGEVIRFDEYYQRGDFIPDYFDACRRICKKWGRDKIDGFAVIDPTYNKRDPFTGRDNETAFRELATDTGFNFVPYKAKNDVVSGINRVASYLTVQPGRKNPFTEDGKTITFQDGEFKKVDGAPMFFITTNCTKAIQEMGIYQWKETHDRDLDIEMGNDQVNYKEEPLKKNDHTCDEIRYMLMSMPSPKPELEDVMPYRRKKYNYRVSEVTGY